MNRASLAALACLTVGGLASTGCGPKEFGSICSTAPAPAECQTSCDPLPGAVNACPSGYHCAPDGLCDAQCTQAGGQCGDGYVCSADGRCEDDGTVVPPPIDAACPAVVFTPMPTTPSIALILDGSGSMDNTDISPTRYRAMTTALTGAGGVVTSLETKAYFGSHVYYCDPNNNTPSLLSVPRALNNAAAINSSITGFTPGGNTPTPTAINSVVATFAANPPPAGSPPAIVLATDGEPNQCGGGDTRPQSVAAAAAAYAAGIPVYVLAINQNSTHFQDMANAGQGDPAGVTVPYFPVSNATQLAAAFQTIINGVISCDLALTSSIDAQAAMQGTVTINGVPLTYGTDWTLVGGNTIHLEAGACATLKAATNPMVSATFPCGAVIL